MLKDKKYGLYNMINRGTLGFIFLFLAIFFVAFGIYSFTFIETAIHENGVLTVILGELMIVVAVPWFCFNIAKSCFDDIKNYRNKMTLE